MPNFDVTYTKTVRVPATDRDDAVALIQGLVGPDVTIVSAPLVGAPEVTLRLSNPDTGLEVSVDVGPYLTANFLNDEVQEMRAEGYTEEPVERLAEYLEDGVPEIADFFERKGKHGDAATWYAYLDPAGFEAWINQYQPELAEPTEL